MKNIGLLGGMSWESTATYYRLINQETKKRLGNLHSAPVSMVSVDFQEIEDLQVSHDWCKAGEILADKAKAVEAAGAECLVLCTNTMHKVAPAIENAINIPFLHIGDATALEIKRSGRSCIGLLGTAFTMQQDFYRKRLESHGLKVLVPSQEDQEIVHRVIYDELCQGHVREESRAEFIRIINDLRKNGAEGVIEGCTEINLLVEKGDTDVQLFDTTLIHAMKAVDFALM